MFGFNGFNAPGSGPFSAMRFLAVQEQFPEFPFFSQGFGQPSPQCAALKRICVPQLVFSAIAILIQRALGFHQFSGAVRAILLRRCWWPAQQPLGLLR